MLVQLENHPGKYISRKFISELIKDKNASSVYSAVTTYERQHRVAIRITKGSGNNRQTYYRAEDAMAFLNESRGRFGEQIVDEAIDRIKCELKDGDVPTNLQEELQSSLDIRKTISKAKSPECGLYEQNDNSKLRIINAKLRENLVASNERLSECKKTIYDLTGRLEVAEKQLLQKQKAIEAGHAGLEDADFEINKLKTSLAEAHNEISDLREANNEYLALVKEREQWLDSMSSSPVSLQTLVRNSVDMFMNDHRDILNKLTSLSWIHHKN